MLNWCCLKKIFKKKSVKNKKKCRMFMHVFVNMLIITLNQVILLTLY